MQEMKPGLVVKVVGVAESVDYNQLKEIFGACGKVNVRNAHSAVPRALTAALTPHATPRELPASQMW
eukprot:SAG11_NODE_21948_length_415_cov_0.981013_1_plen_66_part_01